MAGFDKFFNDSLSSCAVMIPEQFTAITINRANSMATLNQNGNQLVSMLPRRLVRILVVDPDRNVPADQSTVLDKELLTDLTDDALKLELELGEEFKNHNAYRLTLKRETTEGREVSLKAVKVSDLAFRVITISHF